MEQNRARTIVLFPGLWGNRNETITKWWMHHVREFFKENRIVLVTYGGTTLAHCIEETARQLEGVEDGALCVCHSLGAQVARGVAGKRPELFTRAGFVSAFGRRGLRGGSLKRAFKAAPRAFLRCLIGKPLMLETMREAERLMLVSSREEDKRNAMAQDILQYMEPQPVRLVRQLAMPGLRARMPPMPCPIMAVIPREDALAGSDTDFTGERVLRCSASGDHALILDVERLRPYLERMRNWFFAP